MKRFLVFLTLLSWILGSCSFQKDYDPDAHLSVQQQDLLMERIIRYIGRTPDGVSPGDRFSPVHDKHYSDQRRIHRLDALYKDDDNYFFLVSRIAPMEPDSLVKRSVFLFDKMVKGEDLEPFYSSRSGNTDYIEFPDDRTYFDTEQRIWRTK